MKIFYIFIALVISASTFSQDVLMQNGTFNRCEPDRLYDSGGPSAAYANNEDYVTTICPNDPGDFIRLQFTAFSTQLSSDILTIYDGPDTSANEIGTYSGGAIASPGTVSASSANASGCLTLRFTSNEANAGPGFAANILCIEPCQTIVPSIASTPVQSSPGVITIFPGQSVDFYGSASFSNNPTGATYTWDFDDGSPDESGQAVSHTFNNTGTYDVVLTVQDTNPEGCTGTKEVSVIVVDDIVTINNSAYPESNFTLEELVEHVLVSGGCSAVDNFSVRVTGDHDAYQTKNYGYFTKGGAVNFPFEEGIIMTSGRAYPGGNAINTDLVSTTHNLAGDPDLEAALGQTDTEDATFVKFNFVPTADTISFRYILASEEYNDNYECLYSDSFAFLLREVGTATYTNIAVLPDGITPVSTTNISINPDCPANSGYFEGYNSNVLSGNTTDTNYNGRTRVLTAVANVTMGATYEIKLVMADQNDAAWDSAIFLEAGSFVLGGELGDDITIAAGTAECNGQAITLDTQAPNGTHTWYQDGEVIPGETGSTIDVTETATYSVDVFFAAGCETSDSVFIEFYPLIEIDNTAEDMYLCNPGAAPYIFDLTENNPLILGTITDPENYLISYYLSQANADNDLNPIADPTTFSGTDGQTIYTRLEYIGSICYDTDSFTLNIIDEPIINPVGDLELCDDISNDGVEQFDLESQSATILGGQPSTNFEVTYYASFADADAGTGQLTSPYTNTVNPQPIYVRMESLGTNNCTTVSTNPVFNLVVNDRAIATEPANMFVCDDMSNDGVAQFNLLSQTPTILGSQAPSDYTVRYFESQANAENNIAPITNPATYSNLGNPQTIYVRVSENATPDCYGYTTFDLIVNPAPLVTEPSPLYECDVNSTGSTEFTLSDATAEILNGQSNITVTYHETLADAQSGDADLTDPYTNISDPQTIYVRLENTVTNCVSTTTLELIVNPIPVANAPTPLEACDDNTDGLTSFDLTLKDAEILGGQVGPVVTYHNSLSAAENGTGALSSPYTNTTANSQTLFVRVTDLASECYDTTELILVVNPLPTIAVIQDYELCDYDNPTDEVESFDLDSKDAEATNGQPNVDVSYHVSQAEAISDTAPLASPYQNISNPQTIYVRLENTLTGCVNTTTFDLIVNPLPAVISPSPLVVCDDNVGDGLTEIDLGEKDVEVTGGNSQYAATYHLTLADAQSGTSPLPIPYTNTSNPQTVYVRVVDTVTGCYDTTELLLQVEQAPVAYVPTPLEYCDPNSDGFGEFDLTDAEAEVTGGASGLDVTYHETLANAENNVNPLPTDYDNIVAFTQTVYVRVVSSVLTTDCATIVPLVLNVLPTPVMPQDIADYELCDTGTDGIVQFDLTTKDAEILGTQDPLQYTLTYHTSLADADAGTSPILNAGNYTNLSNPQTIYVRLEGTNGCYKTGEFELVVNLPPVTFQPEELSICDDDVADEITSFDLTVKNVEITGGDGSLTVEYFTTDADAQAGTNAIDPATDYTNTSVGGNPANPQTLYVRVTDNDTGCTAFRTLTIRVLPNPEPNTDPSDIVLCDDTNTGDGLEVFDLTQNEAYILDGVPGLTATYHETPEDAEMNTGAIADPANYTNLVGDNALQTIYVRVAYDDTGCYVVVSFDILVNPLPEAVAVSDYIICEVNTDGAAPFDLDGKDGEVLGGQDPALYEVTYHASQEDADNLVGALNSPYTNTTNPQQIFVAITNNGTGCSISTVSFFVEVDNGAQANADGQPLEHVECDYLGDNDGFAQFDLTLNNPEVLDGQDASTFTVSYYLTEADAETGTDPIPNIYENISNPQTIYVRVDNDEPDAGGADSSICHAVAELTLRVDLRPIFDLDDSYTLCVDTNGTEAIGLPFLDTGLSATGYTFEWGLDGTVLAGETGPSLTATQSGTYMVSVTNVATGCLETDSAVVVESAPPALVAEVVTQAFSENGVIVAEATGIGDYEYSLDGGPWQESGTFEGVSYGEHVVTARDRNGCGTADYPVELLDYPHYFTPNGDGHNETWNIKGFDDQPGTKIYIFDRFGKLLKQISPSGQGWNGTYNGEPMPSSDYWFTVEYGEGGQQKQFRAHFTLKR